MLSARSTLHHASCGCPGTLGSLSADSAGSAAAAAAQVADALVSNFAKLLQTGAMKVERRLKVAYVLPHHHITGGMKVLCQVRAPQQGLEAAVDHSSIEL